MYIAVGRVHVPHIIVHQSTKKIQINNDSD